MSRRTKTLLINFVMLLILIAVFKLYPAVTSRNGGASISQPPATQGLAAPEVAGQCRMNGVLPDASCTPGKINTDVTQANIAQTICVPGYTKTIRPPVSYTDNLKTQQMQEYGFTDNIRLHEEDHLISLELGGSPSDTQNLWPEPHASPNPKDKVENFLHDAVCSGRITLQEAQTRIAKDWTTAEQGL